MRKLKNNVILILFLILFITLKSSIIYAEEANNIIDETEQETQTEENYGPGYSKELSNIENINETLEYVEVATNIESDSNVLIKYQNAYGIKISDEDYNNLLHITEAEARGKDLKAKILVANVIINRFNNGGYNNLTEVIFKKNQFSPIKDGSFWNTVTESTIEAVNQALNGIDYSQGATYFMNRNASSRKNVNWFDTHLTFLFKYNGHEFFK